MSTTSFLLGGARTPIGKFQGGLSSIPAPELGATVIRASLERGDIEPAQVDDVIMGLVLSAGVGQAPARQAALAAGISPETPAVTINKVCGSGLKSVMLADQAIRCGDARVIVAGGMENMSRAPFLLPDVRRGWKFGSREAVDSMMHDGLWCAREDVVMGKLADATANERNVDRAAQDAFSMESHRRAIAAREAGEFAGEIVPIAVRIGRKDVTVTTDEGPRAETTLESLAALRPAFGPEGTATAGNASQISDGAAAIVVAHEEIALHSPASLKARIVATATSGVAPKDLFIAPVEAMRRVLRKADWTVDDVELVELNEAFASQALACIKPLELDPAKVNVHGGAIALGHPIGASGCRVLVTLMHALQTRNLRRGMASLCLGGGNAVAIAIERV